VTRQEAELDRVARVIAASPLLEGALVVGSLAAGTGDDMSDVDLFVVVSPGRFDDAWTLRAELEGGNALVAWDRVDPDWPKVGGHEWISRDLVLVECMLTEAVGGARLAGPSRVLVGPADLADRVPHAPQLTRAALDDYAQEQRELGRVHPVKAAYGELARAVRAAEPAR